MLATLPGFTHIGPVEIEPELDLPLWSFLSQRSPDWMLPGAGDLRDGDVVGLATNPAFVDALLTGANQQATGELRWRNMPLTTRWSPLRKFWQRARNEYDILPLKGWPAAEPLGSGSLAPAGRGSEAVVAFKTPLFRRYPATVVYLYEAADPTFPPPAEGAPLDPSKRKDHTFTGTVGDEITFFGFPIDPLALARLLGGARGASGRLPLLRRRRDAPTRDKAGQHQLCRLRLQPFRPAGSSADRTIAVTAVEVLAPVRLETRFIAPANRTDGVAQWMLRVRVLPRRVLDAPNCPATKPGGAGPSHRGRGGHAAGPSGR